MVNSWGVYAIQPGSGTGRNAWGLKKYRVFCISDFAIGGGMSKPDIKEVRLQGPENDSDSLRMCDLDIRENMQILLVGSNFKMILLTMQKALTTFIAFFLISLISYGQTQTVDTSTQIKHCDGKVAYSVDDMILKGLVGQDLLKPDANPSFKTGLDELKKYFASHALTDTRTKDIVFRVHIGFLVNCNGQAGSFQIVSKGKGDLQELAQQVLEIVKGMPQNWQSATANNNPVDCYQILSFTVPNGALDKFSYR